MFGDRKNHGLTLIEIMVTIVIIAIGVIGAMAFRYYCALDARKADIHITAGRVGLLLLEGWKGTGGYVTGDPDAVAFNPVGHFGPSFGPSMDISDSNPAGWPPGLIDLTGILGSYRIFANRVNYYVTLSYQDVEAPADEPRILNVSVAWSRDNSPGGLDSSYKTVNLTTYVTH